MASQFGVEDSTAEVVVELAIVDVVEGAAVVVGADDSEDDDEDTSVELDELLVDSELVDAADEIFVLAVDSAKVETIEEEVDALVVDMEVEVTEGVTEEPVEEVV